MSFIKRENSKLNNYDKKKNTKLNVHIGAKHFFVFEDVLGGKNNLLLINTLNWMIKSQHLWKNLKSWKYVMISRITTITLNLIILEYNRKRRNKVKIIQIFGWGQNVF